MPYTSPSPHSPSASASHSSLSSRSHSYSNVTTSANTSRTDVPRSQSYLSRHRRTPSISKVVSFGAPPPRIPSEQKSMTTKGAQESRTRSHGSVHQSPAPVSDSTIPAGAIISPADSTHNSSDEEGKPRRSRGRELENLAELQAAIRIIEQHRESSPSRVRSEAKKARQALGLSLPDLKDLAGPLPLESLTPPLTEAARRISHSRSSTESAIVTDPQQTTTPDKSSDDEEDDRPQRPLMVRKKSGELVKPALRPSSVRRRPSSMPGTPTFSKAVHFDNHLEHVRHFLQVDRPLAVSAGSSPVETFDGDVEFPFSSSDELSQPTRSSFEWEINLSNFPADTPERRSLPVRVERVFLSADNKNLVGTVAVANIAFNKFVVARFTLDYWKTTSEVVAEFNDDVRRQQAADGCDRFNFNIKLADQAHLQNRTLFFCVRYNVNGQELWDNNGWTNYQVDFKRKPTSQTGARSRQQSPTMSSGRPVSMPCSFDDFANGFDMKYEFNLGRQPAAKLIGDSPIRLRKPSSKSGPLVDQPSRRNNTPGQAFGNRYDFGASLSAAINAGGNTSGGRGTPSKDSFTKAEPKTLSGAGIGSAVKSSSSSSSSSTPSSISVSKNDGPVPGTKASFTSEKPPLQSSSYHELLDKYCFVGSSLPRSSSRSRSWFH